MTDQDSEAMRQAYEEFERAPHPRIVYFWDYWQAAWHTRDQEIAQLKADNKELQECFNEQNTAHAKAILENERVRQQVIKPLRKFFKSVEWASVTADLEKMVLFKPEVDVFIDDLSAKEEAPHEQT